jgi:arsenate reductase
MAEIGIDISGSRSKSVNEFLDKEFDYVVTVCDRAKQTCPFFPGGKELLHQGFEDPAAFDGSDEKKMAMFRRLRDQIQSWIEEAFGKSTEKASA